MNTIWSKYSTAASTERVQWKHRQISANSSIHSKEEEATVDRATWKLQ